MEPGRAPREAGYKLRLPADGGFGLGPVFQKGQFRVVSPSTEAGDVSRAAPLPAHLLV